MNMPEATIPKEQMELLKEIMAQEFAALEPTLYLDTHPRDRQALMQYNQHACRLRELEEVWNARYGPLMVYGEMPSAYPWQWVDEPWPWDIDYGDCDCGEV